MVNLVKFWVKQAWSSEHRISGVQVVEVKGEGAKAPDAAFVERVDDRVASAKANGAHYLLLAHLFDGVVRSNYVSLKIDDVPLAYRRQLAGWPKRARNGHLATIWFDAEPDVPSAFWLDEKIRDTEYAQFHDRPYMTAGESPA